MPLSSPLADALRDRYVLERELGRGGMATVYLAHDLRHDRPVALKVLHPELARALGSERFLREIKLAARLQHPHILSVHDSGETAGLFWFTMPYVEGETLRARLARERQLPIDDALRIAREAAEALDYAHRHGIVHRDIKPENILLSERHALMADFGIARALQGGEAGKRGSGEGAPIETEERLTDTGISLGTPHYMSPEQATGDRSLDARTDIYSLGAVLYEMLAGEPPFTGPTVQAIVARSLSEPAPSVRRSRPAVPHQVDQSIQRAMARVPADRFSTAAEFARALGGEGPAATVETPQATVSLARSRIPLAVALGLGFILGLGVLFGWLRSHGPDSGTAGTKRLAVLPFESVGDTAEKAFAVGISDEITTRLARVPGLSLVARSSALQYPRSSQSAPQFGRSLGVDYVLDGTVRSASGPGGQKQLRITPELIRVADGTHVWGEPYDGSGGDVFQLQADVAERVAEALRGTLEGSAAQAVRASPTRDLEAFRLYALGRAEWNQRTPDHLERAAQYFQQAIARDSSFARAWAGLADSYALFEYYRVRSLPRDTAYARAKAAALRAIALDSTLAEPHASLNQILRYGYWDWIGSEREIRRAIQLDPNYATAHKWLAEHLLAQGRIDEALAEAKVAVQLDPLAGPVQQILGVVLWSGGKLDEAAAVFRAGLARNPSYRPIQMSLFALYLLSGRPDEAAEVLRAAHDTSALNRMLIEAKRDPAARRTLLAGFGKFTHGLSAFDRGRLYAILGERERCLAELEAALRNRDPRLEFIKTDPTWPTIRDDPRFIRIVKQMGLPP